MSRTERILIYSALLLLTIAALPTLMSLTAAPAWAAALADALGPAKSVTLSGDEGAKDVVLTNKASHLAWGDEAYSRAYSVAYVHTGKPLSQLMGSDSFTKEREDLEQELDAKGADYRQQLEDMDGQLRTMDRESPEFAEARERFQQLLEEYRRWGGEAAQRAGKLESDQFERAYREVVTAVEVVADRKKIDIVYRFIPPGDPFESGTPDGALNAIRMRTALKLPDGLDITPDVLTEMALKVE